MVVAYDGSGFHGFARNDPYPTVGGWLEDHVAMVVGEPVTMTCAGRTDRGVHARGQVVTFDAPETDLTRLHRSLNKMGGGRIVVREARRVGAAVDARFSATWRRYRYSVRNAPVPDPFTRDIAWWVDEPLSVAEMNVAVEALVGQHDFSAFCRAPKPISGAATPPSMVRRVIEARWTVVDDENLQFEIIATAFCHQMVRSIVGLLVDVGRGAVGAEAVAGILARGDRSGVPSLAPPHGLCLWDVGY